MVKIKVRAGKDAVQQAESGGDWGDPPKPGLYHLKLEAIEKKATQGTKDKFYLNCRWRPVGIGREGTKPDEKLGAVWDTVSLTSEDAEWTRARLALALGATPNRDGSVTLDIELDETKPGSPVGTVVLGRVKGGKDLDDNYKPNIGWIGPLNGQAEDSDAFDDDEGEEEEADEPFEDEEGEGDELLSQEDLEAMDNKELGGVAKEFDIDTKAFVKRVKGKPQADRKGLIAAILEAQGDFPPEGEEDEDDDNPF